MFVRLGPITLVLALLCGGGCEKTTHENLDKWKTTEKGPAKLASAFADDSLDPELSAHAGANMVRIGRDGDVRGALDKMAAPRREQVITSVLRGSAACA